MAGRAAVGRDRPGFIDVRAFAAGPDLALAVIWGLAVILGLAAVLGLASMVGLATIFGFAVAVAFAVAMVFGFRAGPARTAVFGLAADPG